LLRQPERIHGEVRAADAKKEQANEEPGHCVLREIEGESKAGADRSGHDDVIDRECLATAGSLGIHGRGRQPRIVPKESTIVA